MVMVFNGGMWIGGRAAAGTGSATAERGVFERVSCCALRFSIPAVSAQVSTFVQSDAGSSGVEGGNWCAMLASVAKMPRI
jgi:hypothetical protein